jgi:hypothetical protein
MNKLQLRLGEYPYEIDGVLQPVPHKQTDFVVDGQGLGDAFGFEADRPWFGQTPFEYLPDHAGKLIEQLRGLDPAESVFDTGRFSLYRCHCGDEQCGVISCKIVRDTSTVRWLDVRCEPEGGPPPYSVTIPEFAFDANDYDNAVLRYAESCK